LVYCPLNVLDNSFIIIIIILGIKQQFDADGKKILPPVEKQRAATIEEKIKAKAEAKKREQSLEARYTFIISLCINDGGVVFVVFHIGFY
jgi:hypothetical protein